MASDSLAFGTALARHVLAVWSTSEPPRVSPDDVGDDRTVGQRPRRVAGRGIRRREAWRQLPTSVLAFRSLGDAGPHHEGPWSPDADRSRRPGRAHAPPATRHSSCGLHWELKIGGQVSHKLHARTASPLSSQRKYRWLMPRSFLNEMNSGAICVTVSLGLTRNAKPLY
jgi:hypothetical protein